MSAPILPPGSDQPGRWTAFVRPYSNEDVRRLRGSVHIENTLAERGARGSGPR